MYRTQTKQRKNKERDKRTKLAQDVGYYYSLAIVMQW
jgi:hypothetical protein